MSDRAADRRHLCSITARHIGQRAQADLECVEIVGRRFISAIARAVYEPVMLRGDRPTGTIRIEARVWLEDER